MAITPTKDDRLDDVQVEPDLARIATALDNGHLDAASADALWLIACELRLLRKSFESVIGGHALWVRSGDAI